jgi:hypothetical protein
MEEQETVPQLLKLRDQWLIAEIEEIEDVEFGSPDCILKNAKEIVDGNLVDWPQYSSDTEVVVRSSDIILLVSPSKDILSRYYSESE